MEKEKLLKRKEMAEGFLKRTDLDSISRSEWENELKFVERKLNEMGVNISETN